jgi:hypothetical protein
MSDFGTQGGSKAESNEQPIVGKNPGEPKRPDELKKSTVEPAVSPTFPGNKPSF